MRKKFILPLAIFLLMGCATTYDEYSDSLDWYVGEDIQIVLDDKGYPTQIMEIPNGNKVYLYVKAYSGTASRQVSDPSLMEYKYDPSTGKLVNADPLGRTPKRTEYYDVTKSCKTWFEVDESSRVVRYRFEGSGCPEDFNLW